MNKRIIAPIVTIAAMASVAIGTTYAMFTRNLSKTVSVTSGNIDVNLNMSMTHAWSRYEDEPPFDAMANAVTLGGEHDAVFELTGTGDLVDDTLTLDRIAPTDKIETTVSVTNDSNISIKWRYGIQLQGELIPALDVMFGEDPVDTSVTDTTIYGQWSDAVQPGVSPLIPETLLSVTFPDEDDNNNYMNKLGTIKFLVEVVQGNMEVHDPTVTKYGFHDSYLVDEGLETEHWVHEISTIPHFRNIVTNEGNTISDQYPGYGDYNTIFLIKNNIDFGDSAIWTIDDPIQDFVFNGSLEGINEDITLIGYHLNDGLNDTGNMGIFPMARHASFKNLVLDDFVFQNDAGVNCGFFAGQTEDDNYNADRVLRFENIIIKDTCSINSSKSIGSLMGLARGCFDFEAKNVINNASIFGDQSNIAGFVGQASAGSVPTGTEGSWRFENCINNGDVTHIGGGHISGFVNQLQGKIVLTIKDCEQNGKLSDLGQSVAYFTNNSADKNTGAPTTVKEIRFEGTNKVTSEMYTKNGLAATTEAKAEPKAMAEQSSAFAEGSVNNYGNPNNVMNNNPLTLSFDQSNHLKVESGETLDFDYSTLSIKVNGRITISVATNLKTGEGSKILYVEKRTSSILDYSDITKVTHLGYCTPSEAISMPSYQNPYNFDKYYIPYEKMETVGFGTRYDTDNGLAVIDNTGKTRLYESIQNVTSIAYKISLFKNDGTFVGTGDLTVTNVSPFVF